MSAIHALVGVAVSDPLGHSRCDLEGGKMTILAWHFAAKTLRDGRPIPIDGELLRHEGELVLCERGLHASRRILDALSYAPGNTLCRVKIGGKIIIDVNKIVASERTIIWRIDARDVLQRFARCQALGVAHLWRMPAVVRSFLETGEESLRRVAHAATAAAAADYAANAAAYAHDYAAGAAYAATYARATAAAYDDAHAAYAAAKAAAYAHDYAAGPYDDASIWNANKQFQQMVTVERKRKFRAQRP